MLLFLFPMSPPLQWIYKWNLFVPLSGGGTLSQLVVCCPLTSCFACSTTHHPKGSCPAIAASLTYSFCISGPREEHASSPGHAFCPVPSEIDHRDNKMDWRFFRTNTLTDACLIMTFADSKAKNKYQKSVSEIKMKQNIAWLALPRYSQVLCVSGSCIRGLNKPWNKNIGDKNSRNFQNAKLEFTACQWSNV